MKREGLKILVCGGRDYSDDEAVFEILDKLHEKRGIGLIVHGAAPGADSLAEQWAKARQVPYIGFPAEWNKKGKAAGPERNREMLMTQPDGLIAFPGGTGTEDMVKAAAEQGVNAWRPKG